MFGRVGDDQKLTANLEVVLLDGSWPQTIDLVLFVLELKSIIGERGLHVLESCQQPRIEWLEEADRFLLSNPCKRRIGIFNEIRTAQHLDHLRSVVTPFVYSVPRALVLRRPPRDRQSVSQGKRV